MEIIHVAAECFPMAKVGGLADVVGALPKYQIQLGHLAKVVMPMHKTSFLHANEWDVAYKGEMFMQHQQIHYTIIKEKSNALGFDLYCVDILGLLDRESVYGYEDDQYRYIAFQMAVVDWMSQWQHQPDVVHVHDYHAGLIPFFMRYCQAYTHLSSIKTVLTVHNAQYQGWMDWTFANYFPAFDQWKSGMLEWNNQINPLASAIKCADKVTTVSATYMQELMNQANGLEQLFQYEQGKCTGIINGIDYDIWNPATDSRLLHYFDVQTAATGKQLNKKELCETFGFDIKLPLIIFIGRLVGEKAADLLPDAIHQSFERYYNQFNVLVLGNGNPAIENALSSIRERWYGYYHSQITYNETLSHQMYAGADFLLMPSRVEPCGLNQLYAMRYGTIPIVRRTGGLNDTVLDVGDGGYGICFNQASLLDIVYSIGRAIELYQHQELTSSIRQKMMTINNSWNKSAAEYIELYYSIYR